MKRFLQQIRFGADEKVHIGKPVFSRREGEIGVIRVFH